MEGERWREKIGEEKKQDKERGDCIEGDGAGRRKRQREGDRVGESKGGKGERGYCRYLQRQAPVVNMNTNDVFIE